MGQLFSRPAPPSLSSLNDEILLVDSELLSLRARRLAQVARRRSFMRHLVFWGASAYFLAFSCLYLIQFPPPYDSVFYRVSPLVFLPLFLFLVSRAADFFFGDRLAQLDGAIVDLEGKMNGLVQKLESDEQFKKAAQIVQQFHTPKPKGAVAQQKNFPQPPTTAVRQQGTPATNNNSSQARPAPQPNFPVKSSFQTPAGPRPSSDFSLSPSFTQAPSHAPRSNFDKLVDFLLSDGVNNRFALICSFCLTHNGLVAEADLGKVRFKCAACGEINNKNKTSAGKQEEKIVQTKKATESPPAAVFVSPSPSREKSSSFVSAELLEKKK